MKLLLSGLIIISLLTGCGSVDSNLAVTGSVDANVKVNECMIAQENGIFYVFNDSTLLGTKKGISIDPSALYPNVAVPLDIADTFRIALYTQAELDFIALNL